MKKISQYVIFVGLLLLGLASFEAQNKGSQTIADSSREKGEQMKQILLDKFIVPAAAKDEFLQRMKINRTLIKTLPGFITDDVYQREGENGESHFATIAVWKDAAALENAKKLVTAEYQKQKFEMPAFLERLKIKIERESYREFADQPLGNDLGKSYHAIC